MSIEDKKGKHLEKKLAQENHSIKIDKFEQ